MIELGADTTVRTYISTVTTLDTKIRFPKWHQVGHISLFPLGGTTRIGSVNGHFAHRNIVAVTRHHHGGHIFYKGRGFIRNGQQIHIGRRGFCRNHHLIQVSQGGIHSLEILLDYFRAFFEICFFNRFLDLLDRIVFRQYTGQRKITGLHDRIDTATHTRFTGNGSGINHIYCDFFIDNLLLYLTGQFAPYFILIKRTVQQEGSSGAGKLQHFHFLHKIELVTSYKVGFGNQVRRTDRLGTETQVRYRSGS